LNDTIFIGARVVATSVLPQVITISTKDRNINRLSIGYAKWPHLRVALPAHDERGCGNLGHPETRILTSCTLLMPAFALLIAPAVRLPAAFTALRTLLYHSNNLAIVKILIFGYILDPRFIFGAVFLG